MLPGDSEWTQVKTDGTIENLEPGAYSVRLKATTSPNAFAGDTATVTLTAGITPTWGIGFGKESLALGNAFTGYTPAQTTVTVTNTGNQPTGGLSLTLDGTDKGSFTLAAETIDSIAAGGSATFGITPTSGLPYRASPYKAKVKVSGAYDVNELEGTFSKELEVEFSVIKTETNQDGTITITIPDGGGTVIVPEDSEVEVNRDGTVTVTVTITDENETPVTVTVPGGSAVDEKDGKVTVTLPNGGGTVTIPTVPEGATTEVLKDGKVTVTLPEDGGTVTIPTVPEGSITEVLEDGKVTVTLPKDGGTVTIPTVPEGSTTEVNPDGKVTVTLPEDGGIVTVPGGSTVEVEGGKIIVTPDGGEPVEVPPGAAVDNEGKITLPPSANANLETLSISAGTLTPAFNVATIAYNVSVSNATKSITLAATTDDDKATIATGALGSKNLNVGKNEFKITVTAEDKKSTKTYTLTVTRAAEEVSKPPVYPNVTSVKAPITKLSVVVKKKLKLSGMVGLYTTGNKPIKDPKLTWTSSKPKVATVSNGTVKAGKKAGKTVITVKSQNGTSLKINITVVKKANKLKKLTGTMPKLKKNKPAFISLKGDATNVTKVTWKVKGKGLKIDKYGMATATKAGKYTITATAGGKKWTKKVTVK
jgi:hypothetical protein